MSAQRASTADDRLGGERTASPAAGENGPGGPPSALPDVDVLSRLGHDLRSPLNGIVGLVRIMLMKLAAGQVEPARLVHQLELVQSSADQMLATIERVVEVARLDIAPAEPGGEPADCRDLVAAVATDFQPAAGAGPDVCVDLPDHPVPFAGPPELLGRLLTELVDNAVKYTDGPRVYVRVLPARAGSGASIEVSDAGPGIEGTDQRRIFEPFQRGEAAADRPTHGSGLGLYLARRLAARCGLRLGLTSTPGSGSTFRVESAGTGGPRDDGS